MHLSRRDFGFVIAKILALIAFRSAIVNAIQAIIFTDLFFSRRWSGAGWQEFAQWAPFYGYTLFAAFIGIKLWIGAEKFGDGPDDAVGNPTVTISRNLIVQGLATGAAIWMLIPLVAPIALLAKWFFVDQRAATTMPVPTTEMFQDGAYLALGIGLLIWARKLTKSEELTTTE